MSIILLKFAESFVRSRISPDVFSNAYIELWRIERDAGILQFDPRDLSECLSTIFCLADMYCPDTEVLGVGELDGCALEAEVGRVLAMLSAEEIPSG